MGFASLGARRTAPARRISAHLSSGRISANLGVSQMRLSATVPRHLRHRAVLRRVCRIVEQDADAAPGDRVELGLEPERAEGREHKGWKPSKWTAVSGSERAKVQSAPWLSDWQVQPGDLQTVRHCQTLSGASVRPAVGCCQSCRALSGAVEVCCQAVRPGLSVQWDARAAPTVWPSARSLEITRDHPRPPETTRDHPRSPEITRDHPRSPEITRERVLRLHPDTRSASTAWHMRESTTPQAALWSSPSSHARSSPPPLTPAGRGRGAFGQADQRRWPGGGGGEVKAARWVDLSHRCSRLGRSTRPAPQPTVMLSP